MLTFPIVRGFIFDLKDIVLWEVHLHDNDGPATNEHTDNGEDDCLTKKMPVPAISTFQELAFSWFFDL